MMAGLLGDAAAGVGLLADAAAGTGLFAAAPGDTELLPPAFSIQSHSVDQHLWADCSAAARQCYVCSARHDQSCTAKPLNTSCTVNVVQAD